MSTDSAVNRLRLSPVRKWAVLAIVTTIFFVPAMTLLLGPGPARFGFQMYSGLGEASATWTDTNGTSHDVDLTDHVAVPRIEVDWITRLPQRLCTELPDAVTVEVRQTARGGDRVKVLACAHPR